MQKIWTMPASSLESRVANKVWGFQEWFNKVFWANAVDISKQAEIRNMLRNWVETEVELNKLQKEMKGLISKHGTDNPVIRDLMKEYAWSLAQSNKLWVTSDMKDKLFAGNKLSKEGYGMLTEEWSSWSVKSVNTADADAYANSSRMPWADANVKWSSWTKVQGDYIQDKMSKDAYDKLQDLKDADGKKIYEKITTDWGKELQIDISDITDDKITFVRKNNDWTAVKHTMNTENIVDHTTFNDFSNNDKNEWKAFRDDISGSDAEKEDTIAKILEKSWSTKYKEIAKEIISFTKTK